VRSSVSHSDLCNGSNNVSRRIQIVKLHIARSSPCCSPLQQHTSVTRT
jgi:hypothetical protein